LNVYEREKTLGLVAAYERRLEEIDLTLKVAAQGKYGICERCGNPIDPERLKIFPETRLCVNCKNIVEQEQRRLRMG
jgi:DnaK suppressor protein